MKRINNNYRTKKLIEKVSLASLFLGFMVAISSAHAEDSKPKSFDELFSVKKSGLKSGAVEEFVTEEPAWVDDPPKEDGKLYLTEYYTIDLDGGFERGKREARSKAITELRKKAVKKFGRKYLKRSKKEYYEQIVATSVFIEEIAIRNDKKKYYMMISISKDDVTATFKNMVADTYVRFAEYIKNPQSCLDNSLPCLADSYRILSDSSEQLYTRLQMLISLTGNRPEYTNVFQSQLNEYQGYADRIVARLRETVPIEIAILSSDSVIGDDIVKNKYKSLFATNGWNNVKTMEVLPPIAKRNKNTLYLTSVNTSFVSYAVYAYVLRVDYNFTIEYGDKSIELDDYFTDGIAGVNPPENAVRGVTANMAETSYTFFESILPLIVVE